MMMKIYTKTGDSGQTSLAAPGRVSKASALIQVIGDVDELNSYVGLVIATHESLLQPVDIQPMLIWLQHCLFNLGARLASPKPISTPCLSLADVQYLERSIDGYQAQLPPLKHFILPSGHLLTAQLHVCRSICRRAERQLVALMDCDERDLSVSLMFLNRLSDALFVWARWSANVLGIEDVKWEADYAKKIDKE